MNSATSTPAPSSLSRNEYGALNLRLVLTVEQQAQVVAFLESAVKAGLLPAPFITSGKKELECLNLDVYDVLIFRGKVRSLVVQARSFWKHLRKGHTREEKTITWSLELVDNWQSKISKKRPVQSARRTPPYSAN